MNDLAKLRALAEAATPGPWKMFNLVHTAYEVCKADDYASGGVCMPHILEDAKFIAACSPDRILALIAEIEELRKK